MDGWRRGCCHCPGCLGGVISGVRHERSRQEGHDGWRQMEAALGADRRRLGADGDDWPQTQAAGGRLTGRPGRRQTQLAADGDGWQQTESVRGPPAQPPAPCRSAAGGLAGWLAGWLAGCRSPKGGPDASSSRRAADAPARAHTTTRATRVTPSTC